MNSELYQLSAELEDVHWWYVARRRIIKSVLKEFITPSPRLKILEAGCGTGGNLKSLTSLSNNVTGLELDKAAAEIAQKKTGLPVYIGKIPDNADLLPETYDLVLLLDVLEHIDDEKGALLSIEEKLRHGGHLLVTVPAYQFLWSSHDELHGHKRRYTKNQLTTILQRSNFKVKYISYFNCFLFPIILLVRQVKRNLLKKDSHDLGLPPALINKFLTLIMSGEIPILKLCKLPFGVSLIALCEKIRE